jgi:hypothetical protein
MRADECSCVDHGCCGISYAGCPVHDLPIGSDAAPQPAEATLESIAARVQSETRLSMASLYENEARRRGEPAEATGAVFGYLDLTDHDAPEEAEATGAELPSGWRELSVERPEEQRCWGDGHGRRVYQNAEGRFVERGGLTEHRTLARAIGARLDCDGHAKPPTAEPRAVAPRDDAPLLGVTHEEAQEAFATLCETATCGVAPAARLQLYLMDAKKRDRAHAELERRAREVVTSRHLPTSGEGVPVRRVMAAIDALAELLGERSDSSEGGRG